MLPEIQLEQLLHYTIGAHELIPQVQSAKAKKHTQAIIPYGSPLYTGVLQAAAYLSLQPCKRICFITTQTEQSEIMIQQTGIFGPIMGKEYEITPIETKLPQRNIQTKKEKEKITRQLGYNLLIQGIETIHRISIRETLSAQEKKHICDYLQKKEKINIVWLANISSQKNNSALQDIEDRKKSKDKEYLLFQLFAKIHTQQHILAYTGEKDKAGFTCIVA